MRTEHRAAVRSAFRALGRRESFREALGFQLRRGDPARVVAWQVFQAARVGGRETAAWTLDELYPYLDHSEITTVLVAELTDLRRYLEEKHGR